MKNPTPSIRLDVYLSDVGYQADVFVDGREVYSQCRDFTAHLPDDRPLSVEKARWFNGLAKLIEDLRRGEGEDPPRERFYQCDNCQPFPCRDGD